MGKNNNRNTGNDNAAPEQAPSLQDQLVEALKKDTAENADSILSEEELAALKGTHEQPADTGGVTIIAEKIEIDGEVIINPPVELADLKQVIDKDTGVIGVDTAGEAADDATDAEGDKPPVEEDKGPQEEPQDPPVDAPEVLGDEGDGVGGDINAIDIPEFVAPEIPDAPVPDPDEIEEPESDDTDDEPEVEEPAAQDTVVKDSDADLRRKLKGVLPDDALEAWDYDSLYLYHTKGAMPLRTPRGEWPIDIRRKRDIKAWSNDSILDWVDENIKTPKGIDDEDIFTEVYRRSQIPGNWSHEDAIAYVKTGKKPDYTKHGVLLYDVMRDGADLSHWTHLELRSALLNEIESPHSKEDMVDALRKRLGLKDTFSKQRLLDSLEESPTEANMDNTLLKSRLEEFKAVMIKPAVHLTDASAGTAHKNLWNAIRDVIRREPADFPEGWNILLNFVNENYNTLFQMERRHKGWAHIQLSKSALATYEYMLTLMTATRAPNNRVQALGALKLNTILTYVTSEQERSNVIHFYS